MPRQLKIEQRVPCLEQLYVDAFKQEPKLSEAWVLILELLAFQDSIFESFGTWIAGWSELGTSP